MFLEPPLLLSHFTRSFVHLSLHIFHMINTRRDTARTHRCPVRLVLFFLLKFFFSLSPSSSLLVIFFLLKIRNPIHMEKVWREELIIPRADFWNQERTCDNNDVGKEECEARWRKRHVKHKNGSLRKVITAFGDIQKYILLFAMTLDGVDGQMLPLPLSKYSTNYSYNLQKSAYKYNRYEILVCICHLSCRMHSTI